MLCGSWPGQQRSASSLTDVVRGATSRIRDYLRVNLEGTLNSAVTSRAVEPVVLTLAELLDNAARHSRPDTAVEVNFRSAHNGVAITIDDAGVAMDADELQRAADLLVGDASVDIHRLGDPPRVGFAVAGVLAARYGFRVSVDSQSPTAACAPWCSCRARCWPPSRTSGRPNRRPRAARGTSATAGGLPKRSRVAVAERPAEPAAPPPGRPRHRTPGTGRRPARPARPPPASAPGSAGRGRAAPRRRRAARTPTARSRGHELRGRRQGVERLDGRRYEPARLDAGRRAADAGDHATRSCCRPTGC